MVASGYQKPKAATKRDDEADLIDRFSQSDTEGVEPDAL
jgi:hypothetical protein